MDTYNVAVYLKQLMSAIRNRSKTLEAVHSEVERLEEVEQSETVRAAALRVEAARLKLESRRLAHEVATIVGLQRVA